MEEFRQLFLRMCKEYGSDPQEAVLQRISDVSNKENNSVLDLSNHSLSMATCTVLGKMLSNDLMFTSLILSDCMLNEEGVKLLLNGLAKNTLLQTIDLRGNNLRQTSSESLGSFLKNNHTLTTLVLEWNSLGVWEGAFSLLCEGLATNTSLRYLDLRNNQIDHKGAQEIARSLCFNSCLSTLDLRWNNIGLVGGRAVVDMLHKNKGLTQVNVAGNNIPKDVVSAIEIATTSNEGSFRVRQESMRRTNTLNEEIEILKSEKKRQMITLMDDVDLTRSQLDLTNKSHSQTINHLQGTLEERKAALNALRANLDMCEASLRMSEQKVKDSTHLLEICRKENQELIKNHGATMKRERDDKNKIQDQLEQELRDCREYLNESQQKCSELDRKSKMQHDQITLLKENIVDVKAEQRLFQVTAEDHIANERKRMHAEIQDNKEKLDRERERLHSDSMATKDACDAQISKLKESYEDLMRDNTDLKSRLNHEICDNEENVRQLRKQLKDEESTAVEKLQEKFRNVTTEKSELSKQLSVVTTELAELQAIKNSLSIENDGFKRALNNIQRQQANKEIEIEERIAFVRNDYKKKILSLEDECSQSTSLREKLVVLETKLAEQASSHRITLEEKERSLERAEESLRQVERRAEQEREEEKRRATALQTAVLAYVQGTTGSDSPRRI